jgi:FtsZ-binding cell division protein ZapB
MTEERMAEGLTERLEQLEKSVRRAAETITRLRKERDSLQAKVAGVEAKLATAEGDRAELTSLRQERKEVLAQVDGILKELDRLDIQ